MTRATVFATLTVALIAALCARARADEFYNVRTSEAVYIAWTQDSTGHLQGQIDVVSLPSNGSTQLRTVNAAFTGTRSGSDVSLTFGLLTAYSGSTWTGHFTLGNLTLTFPTNGVPGQITLAPGTFDQFRIAAARLQSQALSNQSKVALYNALAEASGAVRAGEAAISGGLETLRAMFPKTTDPSRVSLTTQFARQWAEMQKASQEEQDAGNVVPMTCYQKAQVQYQASQVAYQLAQFGYLDSQVYSAKATFDSAVRQVVGGISSIQAWGPIYNDRARIYASATGGSYNRNIVILLAPEVSTAQKALTYYKGAYSSFASAVAGYDHRAKQENDDAAVFADSLVCSG